MGNELVLSILFFFVALLYSSVGLGGGSSYTALMTIFDVDYELIPTTSLLLNMVVTSVGVLNFRRGGHINLKLIVPFLVTSIPMSYVGGAVPLPKNTFLWLLLVTLVFVAARIYLWNGLSLRMHLDSMRSLVLSLILGALLGFIAGAVGIGGGIYLVPLIILLGLAGEKEAAAAGAVFIFLNSLSGFISRIQRGAFDTEILLPLMAAVLVGGYVGSHFGSHRFSPRTVQKTLGVVIIIAIGYLLKNLLFTGGSA